MREAQMVLLLVREVDVDCRYKSKHEVTAEIEWTVLNGCDLIFAIKIFIIGIHHCGHKNFPSVGTCLILFSISFLVL